MTLKACIYGGGSSCTRQGGDGSLQHSVEFIHKYPTQEELCFTDIAKSEEPVSSVILSNLDSVFDEDLSKSVLQLFVDELVNTDRMIKSMYEFDLDSEEGIKHLLSLLPVMDPDILKDIEQDIWPGYVVDDPDPDLVRAEIKGYLLDYLKKNA